MHSINSSAIHFTSTSEGIRSSIVLSWAKAARFVKIGSVTNATTLASSKGASTRFRMPGCLNLARFYESLFTMSNISYPAAVFGDLMFFLSNIKIETYLLAPPVAYLLVALYTFHNECIPPCK